MPVVPLQPGQSDTSLRHVRQTWTFVAGTTGAIATHTVFTISGRVFVDLLTAFCSDTLTSGGTPAITLGTVGDADGFIVAPTGGAPGLVTNDWWTSAASANLTVGPVVVVTGQQVTSQRYKLLSENIDLVIPTSTVTGGTLIFDVWYLPITDGSSLVPPTPA